MPLSPRLELRQSQSLVMTPQLMQAIKLLALSNLDLAAYVEGELERNPLLERTGEDEAERRSTEGEATPAAGAAPARFGERGCFRPCQRGEPCRLRCQYLPDGRQLRTAAE